MHPALERLENQATFLALEVEQYGGKRGKYLYREMSSILANDLASQVKYLEAHMIECQKILAQFTDEIIPCYKPEYQGEARQFLGLSVTVA